MDSFKLSRIISVESRFGRSVNLERDFYDHISLAGYVLTTTARSALSRLTQALTDNTAARAWTLTGPYGSGKSTFALFAAKLFSYKKNPETLQAQTLIRKKDLKLWKSSFE
jgi:ABC-type molybdenum transport system ATPase subunit/photorepair protein PhrA